MVFYMLSAARGEMRKESAVIFCLLLMAVLITACRGGQNKGFDPARIVNVEAGAVDFFEPVKAVSNTTIRAYGWAADLQAGNAANKLVVVCDGRQVPVTPEMTESRPDVAKYFRNNSLEKTGWEVTMPASLLGIGKHRLVFYAVLSDNTFAPLHCGVLKFCQVKVN